MLPFLLLEEAAEYKVAKFIVPAICYGNSLIIVAMTPPDEAINMIHLAGGPGVSLSQFLELRPRASYFSSKYSVTGLRRMKRPMRLLLGMLLKISLSECPLRIGSFF